MYQVTSRKESAIVEGHFVCEFIADEESDISTLPTSTSLGTNGKTMYDNGLCEAGSSVYIASSSASNKVYILNTQDVWIAQ